MNFLIVALGGAIGAAARYQTTLYIKDHVSSFSIMGFYPLATLIVNVLGSFLFGLAFYLIVEKAQISQSVVGSTINESSAEAMRLFLLVGLLGAFTTFSTFSFELLSMIQKGQWMYAIASVLANVLLSFAALALAYYGSKQLFS